MSFPNLYLFLLVAEKDSLLAINPSIDNTLVNISLRWSLFFRLL